jgi:serine phosphatase RsbU (regulator of sigma subunit)
VNSLRSTEEKPLIEWGVAALALEGEAVSGDLHVVKPFPNGVLVGVVDGLGHGDEATIAARLAVSTLESYCHESVISLVKRCHGALAKTRGVVMSLASFNATEGTISWLGVGNVEGLLLRADPNIVPSHENVVLRGGVVGYQIAPLRAAVVSVMPGDILVMATDGISADFAKSLNLTDAPQQAADRILANHGKKTDDALVLVARYLGQKE